MSSTMRNLAPRRTHKERAQPRDRARLGILEKHKDYTLRARDYAHKKAQLRALQIKALERNEDEFSFGMLRTQLRRKGGLRAAPGAAKPHKCPSAGVDLREFRDSCTQEQSILDPARNDISGRPLNMEVVKYLKTQDLAHIRTMLQKIRVKREELELGSSAVLAVINNHESVTKPHRTVFISPDDVKEILHNDVKRNQTKLETQSKNPRKKSSPKQLNDKSIKRLIGKEKSDKMSQLPALNSDDKNPFVKPGNCKLARKFEERLKRLKEAENSLREQEIALERERAYYSGRSGHGINGVTRRGRKFRVQRRRR